MNKTLYGYYNNGTDNLPFIDTVELLRAAVTHVKQKHIEAFYKTTNNMFIIVLTSDNHKGIYPQERNFKEQVQNEKNSNPPKASISEKTKSSRHKRSKYDPDIVFVTMYLSTTISNDVVKKKLLWNLGRYIQSSLDGTKKRNFRVYVMEKDIYV